MKRSGIADGFVLVSVMHITNGVYVNDAESRLTADINEWLRSWPTTAAITTITRPEVAIYMAGVGNPYGYPHQETLTALADIGATIYGTDKYGTIVIDTNGLTYTVTTEKTPLSGTPATGTGDKFRASVEEASKRPGENLKTGEKHLGCLRRYPYNR